MRIAQRGPRAAMEKARYVYVMTRGPYCKVGISAKPKSRASKLRESSPEPIDIAFTFRPVGGLSARQVEAAAHAYLSPWRARGEWFKCDADLAIMAVRHAHTPFPESPAYFKELAAVDALERAVDAATDNIPRGRTLDREERVAEQRAAYVAWASANDRLGQLFPALHREARPYFDLAI